MYISFFIEDSFSCEKYLKQKQSFKEFSTAEWHTVFLVLKLNVRPDGGLGIEFGMLFLDCAYCQGFCTSLHILSVKKY